MTRTRIWSRSPLRGWLLALLPTLCLTHGGLLPGPAAAQPVLHEPVPVPSLRCTGGVCKRDGQRGDALPDAVLSEDGLVGAPRSTPADPEPIFSPASQMSPQAPAQSSAPTPGQDAPPVRRARVAPDARTGAEAPGERVYHEVFNPAVFPYKRMTVMDAVDDEGVLHVQPSRPHELPVEGNRLLPGRDPFFASVVVDLEKGALIPLPTPAAGLRLLSYEATPSRPLRFLIDSAENLYVIAASGGRHRLIYLVDAPQRYFAGPLLPPQGQTVRLGDLPPVPAVPRRLRKEAERVLRHIGLRPTAGAEYLDVLNRLVGYFRDFSIAPLDEDDGSTSLYLRIALSQRGVCRHRSYAFFITALAAGIPVRYVENELHVFVEVYIPSVGTQPGYWRRINLGGAPLSQRVMGGESRVAYQEKGGDPFERPPQFRQGRAPTVSGLPRRQPGSRGGTGGDRDGGLPPLDGPEDRAKNSAPSGGGSGASALTDGDGKDGGGGTGKGRAGSSSDGKGRAGNADGSGGSRKLDGDGDGEGDGKGDGSGDSDAPVVVPADDISQPDDARTAGAEGPLFATRITLSVGAARRLYRGTALPVRGQVSTPGRAGAAAGLDVLLYLATQPAAILLGRTVTRRDGTFETELNIPSDAPVGHFQLVARVRGDDTRRGSSTGRYSRPTGAGPLDGAAP